MNRKRREIIAANEISELKTYSLGSYNQNVALDGKSKDLPIALYLHGGPGSPFPFSAGCRGMFPEFTEHFIIVCWDQFGCGINNHVIDDSFAIDTFVDMTTDLVSELRKEFPDNPLILLGVSWGSVLAAKAAARMPDCVDGALTYGQVTTNLFFNEECFGALQSSAAPAKTKERIRLLQQKSDYTLDDIQFFAGCVRKHTDGYQNKSGEKLSMSVIIRGLLTSPDYSIKDCIAIVKNGFMENKSVWNELLHIDLRDTLREIRIPYRIIQGDTDIVTSTKSVSEFVEQCRNEVFSLRVLPDSGHLPGPSGMNEVLSETIKLTDQILACRK